MTEEQLNDLKETIEELSNDELEELIIVYKKETKDESIPQLYCMNEDNINNALKEWKPKDIIEHCDDSFDLDFDDLFWIENDDNTIVSGSADDYLYSYDAESSLLSWLAKLNYNSVVVKQLPTDIVEWFEAGNVDVDEWCKEN